MHPEILRELSVQHGRDLRVQAAAARTTRTLRRGHRLGEADEFFVDIPDYVDGTFQTGGEDLTKQLHGQVPAARHAA
jgi:hypothetical protein